MVDDPADFLISLPDGQRGYYGQGIIKKMRVNLALQRIQLRIPAGDFLFIKLIYQDVQFIRHPAKGLGKPSDFVIALNINLPFQSGQSVLSDFLFFL